MVLSGFDHVDSFWQGYLFEVADGLVMLRSSVAAFYSWLLRLFYSFVRRWEGLFMFWLLLARSEVEQIVYWVTEILFAAQIVFRGLHRCVSQQELNLLQLTTSVVTQLRTGSPQIMRRNML